MSQEQFGKSNTDPAVDDSYWTSLFQMEESFAADHNPEYSAVPELPGENEQPLPLVDESSAFRDIPAPPLPEISDPWQIAQETMEADRLLRLIVQGHNKGGLLVHWNGIQGFVPASQLIDFPQFHIQRERARALADWDGRELTLKIIEVDKSSSRLIFSERATLVAAEQREVLLLDVRPGDKRIGIVTNLTEFGAFVDLGGLEGLIHKSEISWSRVVHPGNVLQPRQQVEVLVLNVDKKEERVGLSMKRLRPDPWLDVETRYRPGQLVSGPVGSVTTFGAFVVLEEELEGLVHISELAEGMFLHPRDVVRTGDIVTARVLSVDGSQKRLALSMRGVNKDAAPGP